MSEFVWEARARTGELRKGVMDADDEPAVQTRLRAQQLMPTKIKKKGTAFNFKMGTGVDLKAVVTFTRILAFELGQWGITCNSFGATPIMTDMIKGVPKDKIDAVVNGLAIKRLGTHEDCINVCDFFISPASDNITGQVIYLGGIT